MRLTSSSTFFTPNSNRHPNLYLQPSTSHQSDDRQFLFDQSELEPESIQLQPIGRSSQSNPNLNLYSNFNFPSTDSSMKFSHSLQFNAVPDWADKYVAYSNLKKAIYNLEKDAPTLSSQPYRDDIESESAGLLNNHQTTETDRIFTPLMDKELKKIVDFYSLKSEELFKDLETLQSDLVRTEEEEVMEDSDDGSDDDDEDGGDRTHMDSPYTTVRGGGTLAGGRRPSMDAIFRDPRKYNEAAREQQKRSNRRSSKASISPERATDDIRNPKRSSSDYFNGQEVDLLNQAQDEPTTAETSVPDVMAISNQRAYRQRTSSTASQSGGGGTNPRWSLFRKKSQRKSLGIVIPDDYDPQEGGLMSASRSEMGNSSLAGDKSMSVWTAENDWAIDMRITFKKRITDLFVAFSELKQFVQLNETGMKKILKKYDKITNSRLKDRFMNDVVQSKFPFTSEARNQLDEHITTLTQLYAKVVTSGDVAEALTRLKTHLREQVVWQRNTVWREMIGIERRAQGASLERAVQGKSGKNGDQAKPTRIWTPFGYANLPSWFGIPTLQLLVAFTLLTLLLKAPGLRFFGRVEEQNCLALLVFCTVLWATEVIPLFVTSLMVPLLVVTLRVGRSDDIEDRRLTASETTKWIFSQMFAPNMCLLLGGFTLAAALSKYGIDKVLATKILRLAGTRPSFVLLAHMCVACFASMWISNVAAPVLMYSLIQPILRNLPPASPYASSLIMGIALASNIGGQTSPIASPQNLIALQYMDDPVGWLQWFAITLPVSGLSLVVIWMVLLWAYGSGKGTTIKQMNESRDKFSKTQYFISAVSVATIALWCFERNLEYILGDMGIIAIIPLVLFFGTGILSKEDFNNFLWTIVFLAMGGIALGKAVTSSGLLESLDEVIQGVVIGMPIWKVLVSLLFIALIVATFISHTIAAVLLVPIAAQVGESLSEAHPRLLIMATTLTASAAMGLPVSGFPNMTAVSMEDETGRRYVTVKDFLRVGVLASILATIIVGTLGFAIMLALGL